MIHPSYVELMNVVNGDGNDGEEPVINSRYNIVCATAKRARQLIDGAESLIGEDIDEKKPLSIAVEELYEGELKILTEEEAAEKSQEAAAWEEEKQRRREEEERLEAEAEAAAKAEEAPETEAVSEPAEESEAPA